MKVNVCDVCVAQPTLQGVTPLRIAVWRIKGRSGVMISLCNEHRDVTKGKADTEILDIGVKAEGALYIYQGRIIAEAKKSKR